MVFGIARGVIQAMFWNKIKIVRTALVVAVATTGVSGLTFRIVAGEGQPGARSAPLDSSPPARTFPVSAGEGKPKEMGDRTGISARKGEPLTPQVADRPVAKAEEPTTARGYYERGRIHERNKRYAEALADYSKAIELDSQFIDAYFSRSSLYAWHPSLQMRAYAKAVTDLTKILEIEPKYYSARFNRALCYESLRDYDQAIADYSKVIDEDTDFSRYGAGKDAGLSAAHHYRGRAYQWYKSDYAKAAADYTEALRLAADAGPISPNYGETDMLHYRRGQVYHALKEYAKAETDFAIAFQRLPDYANLLSSWAWQLATCPDPQFRDGKKALQYARNANEKLGGKDPERLDTVAAAYAELGQFDEARKWEKQAIELLGPKANARRQAMQARLKLYETGKPFRTE
jgi:tetratricopeptide (TPR) repeat protein